MTSVYYVVSLTCARRRCCVYMYIFLVFVSWIRVDSLDNAESLRVAAQSGNLVEVERLLYAGTLAEEKDIYGNSALYYAASAGHVPIITSLLRSKADLQGRSYKKWTPLHVAAWEGHYAAVEALLVTGEAEQTARGRATVQLLNLAGQTARGLAEEAGYQGVANQLKIWEDGWRNEESTKIAKVTQTPMDNANIRIQLKNCLSSDPVIKTACVEKYGKIPDWNTHQVTDMSNLLSELSSSGKTAHYPTGLELDLYVFNEDISKWDTSNVVNMEGMFNRSTTNFNADISKWNVGKVTNMAAMFAMASSFNADIRNWNVANVTNMRSMFWGASSFNADISKWNVGEVTDMGGMFWGATSFNADISNWDVSKVTEMRQMFEGANSFDAPIGSWDVSQVTGMWQMFATEHVASSPFGVTGHCFSADISSWNVGKVTNMQGMFKSAKCFNADISGWDIANVTNMDGMLCRAASFNKDITSWPIPATTLSTSVVVLRPAGPVKLKVIKFLKDGKPTFISHPSLDASDTRWDAVMAEDDSTSESPFDSVKYFRIDLESIDGGCPGYDASDIYSCSACAKLPKPIHMEL
eukprot:gnl/MRDRNA2_/MRDRNA2_92654_c0_seq1.p1 gnl/MRDRNA2_/MRDRNA2_92654_c0~~gnl/MRDRNA2_/MRDRNA2_92654_c0_seq1.p1  ORF type:complete len:581 (+),score=64.45 gnl/MRDRNA2_/MRDRNA2_92654_c0_seq1:28-1770(+)